MMRMSGSCPVKIVALLSVIMAFVLLIASLNYSNDHADYRKKVSTNKASDQGMAGRLPVLPDIHGFGVYTTAGSGRHHKPNDKLLYKVRNLNDSGKGSLRWALHNERDENEARTIIFETSGTISLMTELLVPNYTTISGQTAPQGGITITGNRTVLESDILVQHLRFRLGQNGFRGLPTEGDCLSVRGNDVIIDHNTFSWGIDENVEIYGSRVTFTNNIVSWGLANSIHPKGEHSKGLITLAYNHGRSGAQNIFISKNLFAFNKDRNPVISAGSAVVVNNYVVGYNNGIVISAGNEKKGPVTASVESNYIDNSVELASSSERAVPIHVGAGNLPGTKIFIGDKNIVEGKSLNDPWEAISNDYPDRPDLPVPNEVRAEHPPIEVAGYNTIPTAQVPDYILKNSGARPSDRDEIDKKLVELIVLKQFKLIDHESEIGGLPRLPINKRKFSLPELSCQKGEGGYTMLEHTLHNLDKKVRMTQALFDPTVNTGRDMK